ncbi:hypothetical protein CAI21_00080 [Alkalilimnicola ehrlichii]|uniref:J domain-containing protein n=2 Tax=Alkalilimnicola ehrlichii TaxID=351052 RepID=A0A3E0X4N8_9GAMM|nr:DNA-J related domain-containing protein [Alkalilimnicola ehrlichii]RFA31475.1 hypothetical protein CAI21_00080 [Alkalilimnicola ehrlichii]RFA39655.1 hypothetical protein CAL65_02325 [Alkalilimnicola ehrlichii]
MSEYNHLYASALQNAVLDVLHRHPQGISEFELIRSLEDVEAIGIEQNSLRDPLSLFRTHFILFHYLYRLRERLRREGQDLDIHCLRIALKPYRTAEAGALDAYDSLAAYYLDLANLESVDAEDVEALLAAFWRRFRGRDQRAQALAVLGLQDPVAAAEIKQQYRRLVMRHHPDRGGEKETLQALNEAMAVLEIR